MINKTNKLNLLFFKNIPHIIMLLLFSSLLNITEMIAPLLSKGNIETH
jgi:hypothetical protein